MALTVWKSEAVVSWEGPVRPCTKTTKPMTLIQQQTKKTKTGGGDIWGEDVCGGERVVRARLSKIQYILVWRCKHPSVREKERKRNANYP